eukprot:4042320-Amphidinium_carterae.3
MSLHRPLSKQSTPGQPLSSGEDGRQLTTSTHAYNSTHHPETAAASKTYAMLTSTMPSKRKMAS